MAHEHPGTSADQKLLDGRYKFLKTINEGSHAKVKLAVHLPTGTQVAIKIVTPDNCAIIHKFLMREIQCMKALQHPNIVQLYEVIETKTSFFLVMEYLDGGSLMDHLTAHGRMREREARVIFRKLLTAVYYFHQRGFAHRDIKPENVLFDCNKNPKIIDFGFSTEFTEDKLSTSCGTPCYAAPELIRGEDYEGPAVDVWSLGVTLYRMVAGTLPFKAQNWNTLGKQVTKGKYTVPYYFSLKLESLLEKMLKVNPMERRDLIDIMSHPWLSQDEEDLMPYSEPINENIDPWVRREMALLGFRYDDIQDTLTNRTFNDTMATYRILQSKKPKFQSRIIHVKPYNPTEQSPAPGLEEQPGTSIMTPVEQYHDDYELGQRGEKPVTPPALHKVRIVTPEPSPVPRTVTPEVSPEFRPISHSPRPWRKSPTPIKDLQSGRTDASLDIYGLSGPSSSPSSSTSSSSSSGSSLGENGCWRVVGRCCCNCLTKWCLRLLSRRHKVRPF